jgi:uncharacterized protein (TIGR02246 family)
MSEEKKIEAVAHRFIEAWNAHDMKTFASLFTEDAEFVNVYGSWWTGRQRIEAEHASVHETVFRQSHLTAMELRARHLAPESAILHMRWQLTGLRTPTGESIPDRTGVLLFVLVSSPYEWHIAAAQNTDIVARPL